MKKNIAFVLDSMTVGGVEKALLEVLYEFDYKRYDVTLWLKDSCGPFQKLLDPRVKVEYWGYTDTKATLISQLKNFRLGAVTRGVFYRILSRLHVAEYDLNATYSVKCLPLCTDFVYDCVIAYQVLSPSVVATSLYRLKGKKKVLWVHGRNVRPKKLNSFFDKEYSKFDFISCVSEATKQEFGRDFPRAVNKAQVLYNILNPNPIILRADESSKDALIHTSIVTVGRLTSIKGQQMIPRTTRLLLDAGYDIHWYLVGDGPLRETVETEIAKYNVADRVILLGTQINPYPYIKNCDIYVQPSLSEGWCLTVQEARILQKPIVTTPLPVMHEQIISGENGLIAEDTTPEALAESIKLLLDYPELRKKFEKNLSHDACNNSGELQKLYDFIES